MPDDARTVNVSIPVEARLASALDDAATRARAGELVSAMLHRAGVEQLLQTMRAFGEEAERRGMTDEILEAELAAWKAERRAKRSAA